MLPALICALLGAVAGLVAPRLIATTPDIVPDAAEDPDDFPELVPFAEVGARRGVRVGSVVAGAVAAGVLGAVFGLSWGTGLLLVAIPFAIALAVIDYVTWFLPNRLIAPAALSVAVIVVAAAVALGHPAIVAHAVIGALGMGGYYGLLWLISPRIMALGDVKLGALIGLTLGPWGLAATVLGLLAAGVVSLLALPAMRLLGNTRNQGGTRGALRAHVPFGPSMLVGAWLAPLLARALGVV
ncbi:MAG: A24 family peptidase [Nocardioides sp.]|uniref:prepilin peptidase n=1 Tax=Nocardioides sp. TaxID=35761 RepID=UPI0039E3EE82